MVDVLGTAWRKKGSWCVSAMGCHTVCVDRPDIDGNIDVQGWSLQLRDPSVIIINWRVYN